jgi:hypothetical protein
MFEDCLAYEAAQTIMEKSNPAINEPSLEYLVATNSCDIHKSMLRDDRQQITLFAMQPMKNMLSLKPAIVRRPVHQLKEEMMKRYEDDGYYFLEAYIDGMMKKGSYRIVDI